MESERTALIVFHGIGQQREFETLNALANSLQGGNAGEFKVSLFREGEDVLPCSSLTFESNSENSTVDLFEAYWSPWTKGKVSLGAVVIFLLQAGWRGLFTVFAKKRRFYRALFGNVETFKIPFTAALQLTFLMLLIFAFTCFGLAGTWITIGYSSMVLGLPVFDQCLLRDLRTWLYFISAAVTLTWALIYAWRFFVSKLAHKLGFKLRGAIMYLLVLITATFLIAGTIPLIHCIMGYWDGHESRPSPILFQRNCGATTSLDSWMAQFDRVPWFHDTFRAWGMSGWLGVLGWLVLTLFALTGIAGYILFLRQTLTAYLGDVVAYLAAYRANEYFALREEIRKRCLKITNTVINRRNQNGTHYYHRILFVGHSLGSVIAYDTLNKALLDDNINNLCQRLRGLITLGSPLDKAAFLFRTDPDSILPTPRATVQLALQPLISNRTLREQIIWLNFYSWLDPISGSLEYYDPENEKSWPGHVVNINDSNSTVPLAAHTQYWSHPEFQSMLRLCLTSAAVHEVRSQASVLSKL